MNNEYQISSKTPAQLFSPCSLFPEIKVPLIYITALILPGYLCFISMNTCCVPTFVLEACLDTRGLLLVQYKDKNSVLS